MDLGFRTALIDAIPSKEDVVWSGIVAEMSDAWLVHLLRRAPDAPSVTRTEEIAGRAVTFAEHSIERTDFIVDNPLYLSELMTLPHFAFNLIGEPPANLLAPAMNRALSEPGLVPATVAMARGWAEQVRPNHGLNGVGALKARALFGYLADNGGRLPTQDQFARYLMEHQAPWAVALCAESRSPDDLRRDVLQAHLMAAQPSNTPAFRHNHWIHGWAGGNVGPTFGGRYAPDQAADLRPPQESARPGQGAQSTWTDVESPRCRRSEIAEAPAGTEGLWTHLRL